MRFLLSLTLLWLASLIGVGFAAPAQAATTQLQLLWPLGRKAYQTNERIDLSVARSAPGALAASTLALTLTDDQGGKLAFTFPLAAAPVEGKEARAVEHLHLNGWLLRPGTYTVEAVAEGVSATGSFELYSHLRRSSFRLGDWGSRAEHTDLALMGEDSLGFNTLYPSAQGFSADEAIRGGLDYLWNCTMSGGHQMDLRIECDWSDPYVLRGGTARAVRRAFQDRVNPNCIGVHFYDEPGLTWHKHPKTGEYTAHNVPAQDRAYQAVFGRAPLQYNEIDPKNPEKVARWMHWGRWKESFMEAAWKDAAFSVREVRSDLLPLTQSVYGWSAFTDGYYFNVVRPLPIISGHGGYDDYGGAYFNPSYTFEFGRMRDLNKPNWYLPAWYQGMPSDRFRLEQYLSFMNNLQGMFKPPDIQVHKPTTQVTSDGVVESNKLMARLGTIFTTMPISRSPVAVLYSLSQNLDAQVKDMKDCYEGGGHGRRKTFLAYLAGKEAHLPLFPLVEEDVLDGTLAAHHKAIVLPGINYLPAQVIAALEGYIKQGGTVFLTDDCQVPIAGAKKLGAPADPAIYDLMAKLYEEKKPEEAGKYNNAGGYLKAVAPLARALREQCGRIGIKPIFECDNPEIITSRQGSGDIEYLFAVNASYDAARGGMNDLKPVTARIALPAENRSIYDAERGGPVAELNKGTAGEFRFGPGQMRVFARTARWIKGVQAFTPVVFSDFTLAQEPLRVELGAALTDIEGRILNGSAPLQIRVTDPHGVLRYELFRATDRGVLKLNLPLAVNDAAGTWKVEVVDLLADTADTTSFAFAPPAQCGAVAGAMPRAVSFGNDRENCYRLFRNHKEVTIACGTSPYCATAAARLAEDLKPYGIRCTIVKAADVNKPRPITAEEAKTWCGLEPGKAEVGDKNNPLVVGFDVRGAVVLLGNPQDNPLIAFLEKARFLPYKPDAAALPGPRRGYLAWQRDGVGYDQESVTLVAYDGAGMNEAAGTLVEAVAGLEPLTRWTLPATSALTPGTAPPPKVPIILDAWEYQLPDRAAAIRSLPNGGVAVLTQDGSLTAFDTTGKQMWQQRIAKGGESWALDVSKDGSLLVAGASQHVVAFDGKGGSVFDVPTTRTQPSSVVTFVAAAPDGSRVAVGAANGALAVLGRDGKTLWSREGIPSTDTKTRPNPCLSGIFTNDGKSLVALTQSEAQVFGSADGKPGAKVGGVNGRFAPEWLGDQLLLSDGRSVSLFAPAEGKVAQHGALPAVGAVVLAVAGKNVLAGSEPDSTVRKLKAAATPQDKPLWENRAPGHLVKKLLTRDGLTIVAYWGGLVRVLGDDGKVRAERGFAQDVSGLAATRTGFVVTLADGQVFGLTAK